MASLSSLRSKLRKYKNLKMELVQVSSTLKLSIEALELASSNMTLYLINQENADLKKVEQAKEDIENKKNQINNKIIPGVNSQITYVKNQIKKEEAKKAAAEIVGLS